MNSTLLAALIASGATTPSLPSAWREAIIASGATDGQLSTYLKAQGLSGSTAEMFWNYLGSKGYVGTLSDRLAAAAVANDLFVTYDTWSSTNKAPNFTLSNGDRTATQTGTGFDSLSTTFGKSTGTGCFEITYNDFPGGGELFVGVGTASATLAGYFVGLDAHGWGYYSGGGKFRSGAQTGYGTSWNSSHIIMVEVNIDTAQMEIFKSGTSQGVIDISALSGPIFPMGSALFTATAMTINCGQAPFSRTPTTGIFAGWIEDADA